MAERPNAAVLKTVIPRDRDRGFESHSLLQVLSMIIYNFLFILLFVLTGTIALNGMDIKDLVPKKSSQQDGIRKLRSHEGLRSYDKLKVPEGKKRSLSGSRSSIPSPSLSPINELTTNDPSLNAPLTDSAKKRLSWLKRNPKPEKIDLDKQPEKTFAVIPAGNVATDPSELSSIQDEPPQLPLLIIDETSISPTTEDTVKKKSSSEDSIKKKSSSGKLNRSLDGVKKKRSSWKRKSKSHETISTTNMEPIAQKRLSWSTPLSSNILLQLPPIDETSSKEDNTINVPLSDNKPNLIDAIRRHDHEQIKTLLNDKDFDPNKEKDEFGNTALFIAAKSNDRISIELFLQNSHVNSLARNKQGLMASALLEKPQNYDSPEARAYRDIHILFFARQFLDTQIQDYAQGGLIHKAHANATIDKDTLQAIIQIIKMKLAKNDTLQIGDREMPRLAAELPSYATDDFIASRFYSYLNRENPQPESFQ